MRLRAYRILLAAFGLNLLAAGGVRGQTAPLAADPYADLTDLSRLMYPLTGSTGQTSSYDRAGGGADGSFWYYLRAEPKRAVMADVRGPGCISRIWVAGFDADTARIEIFIDSSPVPSVSAMMIDFFGSGNLPPFVPPLAAPCGGGWVSYVPIPFRNNCRIEAINARRDDSGIWYNISHRLYPLGEPLADVFHYPPTVSQQASLDRFARQWADRGQDPKNIHVDRSPLDDINGGTFARDTVAYLGDVSSLATYAGGARRGKQMLSVSRSDGAIQLNGIGPGQHAIPFLGNGTVMLANTSAEATAGFKKLYASSDGGVTWKLESTAPTGFSWAGNGLATSSGRLIVWQYRQAGATGLDVASGVFSTNSLYFPTGHGVIVNASDALPGGLVDGTVYYLRAVDLGHFTLHPTPADAFANTNILKPTDFGRGSILIFSNAPWYSDDNGHTWARCISGDGLAGGMPVMTGIPEHWSCFEATNGTLMASTYTMSYPGIPAQIWRSTDNGTSWSKVKQLPRGLVTHFHTTFRHPTSGRWYANTGDGAARQFDVYSDDDGLTWRDWHTGSETISTMSAFTQVVKLVDYGHPTRAIVAGDMYDGLARIGWVDIHNWTMGSMLDVHNQAPRSGGNWFNLQKIGDLWYACSYAYIPGLYVSADLEHWALYHRWDYGTARGLYQYVGTFAGKLHFRIEAPAGVWRHFSISPAQVSVRNAVALSPAKTNLLSSAVSKCESIAGWSAGGTTLSLDSSVRFAGASSVKISKTGASRTEYVVTLPATKVQPNRTYVSHFWVKGEAKYVLPYILGMPGIRALWRVTPRGDGEWTEIWSCPVYIGNNQNIGPALVLEPMYDSFTVWVGAAELVEAPFAGEWSEGGVAQASEHVDFPQALPNAWTHVFSTRILPNSWELGLSKLRLATYRLDASRYVELCYGAKVLYSGSDFSCQFRSASNPLLTSGAGNFTSADVGRTLLLSGADYFPGIYTIVSCVDAHTISLDRSCGNGGAGYNGTGAVCTYVYSLEPTGVGGTAIESTGRWLDRGTVARVAVRYSGGSLRLSVSDGAGVETLPVPLTVTTPLEGDVTLRTGDKDGANVAPHLRCDEYMYNTCLPDDVLDRIFAAATPAAVDLDYLPFDTGQQTLTGTTSVNAFGGTTTLANLPNAGVISGLQLSVDPADADTLMNARIRCRWDGSGSNAVDSPLGPFFGRAHGTADAEGLALGTRAGLMYCYLPMPYSNGAVIEMVNAGATPITAVNYTLTYAPRTAAQIGRYRFHAEGHAQAACASGDPAYRILAATGRGHFLGTVMAIQDPAGDWSTLSGDELLYVNGRTAASIHGTGTDAYFNAGSDLFAGTWSLPFSGRSLNPDGDPWWMSGYRLSIPDAVVYDDGLIVDMEHGDGNSGAGNYYSTAFFYRDDGPGNPPTLPENPPLAAGSLVNGDFEDGFGGYNGGEASGWFAYQSRGLYGPLESCTFSPATDQVYTGSAAQKIVLPAAATEDQGAGIVQQVPVTRGSSYQVTAHLRLSTAGSLQPGDVVARLGVGTMGYTYYERSSVNWTDAPADLDTWHTVSMVCTANTDFLSIFLGTLCKPAGVSGQATLWIDAVTIEPYAGLSPPPPPPVVENGTFESNTESWHLWIGPDGSTDGLDHVFDQGQLDGPFALAVTGTGGSGKGAYQYIPGSWVSDRLYQVNVYVRNLAGDGIQYAVGYALGDTRAAGAKHATFGAEVSGTSNWQLASVAFTYTGDDDGVTIYLRARNAGSSGKAGFSRVFTADLTPLPPNLALSPGTFSHSVWEGNTPANDTLMVRNAGGGRFGFTVTSSAPWVSASPSAGDVAAGDKPVAIVYNTSGLAPGTYQALLTVAAPGVAGSPQKVKIALTVQLQPIPGDFDGDRDVDQLDFGHMQTCFTYPWLEVTDPACRDADFDGNNHVDSNDLDIFLRCFSGPTVPGDPHCIPGT